MTLGQISINTVWGALGGGELRHGRGKAFWRDGDGLNVSLDENKGCWFDYRNAEGGGVIDLVIVALGCDKRTALRWLQDHVGLEAASGKSALSKDDRRSARCWAKTAEALADTLLETTPGDHPQRSAITMIRRVAKAGAAELMQEYRTWSEAFPALTNGMVYAGRQHDKRIQEGLALFVYEEIANA